MEKLKLGLSFSFFVGLGLTAYLFVSFVFSPIKSEKIEELERYQTKYQKDLLWVERRASYEADYMNYKSLTFSYSNENESMNAWTKSILSYMESRGISPEEMNPRIMGKEGEEALNFKFNFESNFETAARLIYDFVEYDPLTEIEEFSWSQQEGADSQASFHLMRKLL